MPQIVCDLYSEQTSLKNPYTKWNEILCMKKMTLIYCIRNVPIEDSIISTTTLKNGHFLQKIVDLSALNTDT